MQVRILFSVSRLKFKILNQMYSKHCIQFDLKMLESPSEENMMKRIFRYRLLVMEIARMTISPFTLRLILITPRDGQIISM